MDADDLERLADMFKGVGHPARIAILQAVEDGDPLTEAADRVGMSRGALQDHQRILIREGLMFRPTDVDSDFELTPLGEYVIQLLEQDADRLLNIMERAEELETAIREEHSEGPGLPVDESELERAVKTEKWRRIDETGSETEG
ncbi:MULTISPECIES: ArsR/SmtB family transcription factor [Haloferacaceae]|uniref:ArsR/SmtB family transcription factor n=1 Tax=Halorubrum glutamatedens TaxID=2707018 RepID=A0ABD5QN29_9EURY|nr:winged helix-turn-helix domain-containing protein [Halobellus captivus]